jgi:hypothetical protein
VTTAYVARETEPWPPRKGWRARYLQTCEVVTFTGETNQSGGYNVVSAGGKPMGGLSRSAFGPRGGWERVDWPSSPTPSSPPEAGCPFPDECDAHRKRDPSPAVQGKAGAPDPNQSAEYRRGYAAALGGKALGAEFDASALAEARRQGREQGLREAAAIMDRWQNGAIASESKAAWALARDAIERLAALPETQSTVSIRDPGPPVTEEQRSCGGCGGHAAPWEGWQKPDPGQCWWLWEADSQMWTFLCKLENDGAALPGGGT